MSDPVPAQATDPGIAVASQRASSGAVVARNSVILLVGQVLAQCITLVVGIAIARVLGPAEYGRYVGAFAFATVFISFTNMGLEKLLIRDMARRPGEASALFGAAGLVRGTLCAGVYVAMIGATYLLHFTAEQRALALLAGAVTEATSLADFLRTVFQGFERMEFDTVTRVLERVVATLLIAGALVRWRTAYTVTVALLLANLIALCSSYLLVRRFVAVRGGVSWADGMAFLRRAIPFGITVTGIGIVTRLDGFLVSLLRPVTEVGWYGAAVSMVVPLTLLPQAFTGALFPHLAKDAPNGRSLVKTTEFSLKWVLIAGVPAGVCLMTIVDLVLLPLLGFGYAPAIAPARILGLNVILVFANTVLFNVLAAIDREHVVASLIVMELLVGAALNLLLLPRLGIRGAAYAAVARELLGLGVMAYDASRHGALRSLFRSFGGPAAAGTVMLAVMSYLHRYGLVMAAAGGAAVYVVTLLATRTVGPDDWLTARRVLRLWRRRRA